MESNVIAHFQIHPLTPVAQQVSQHFSKHVANYFSEMLKIFAGVHTSLFDASWRIPRVHFTHL